MDGGRTPSSRPALAAERVPARANGDRSASSWRARDPGGDALLLVSAYSRPSTAVCCCLGDVPHAGVIYRRYHHLVCFATDRCGLAGARHQRRSCPAAPHLQRGLLPDIGHGWRHHGGGPSPAWRTSDSSSVRRGRRRNSVSWLVSRRLYQRPAHIDARTHLPETVCRSAAPIRRRPATHRSDGASGGQYANVRCDCGWRSRLRTRRAIHSRHLLLARHGRRHDFLRKAG